MIFHLVISNICIAPYNLYVYCNTIYGCHSRKAWAMSNSSSCIEQFSSNQGSIRMYNNPPVSVTHYCMRGRHINGLHPWSIDHWRHHYPSFNTHHVVGITWQLVANVTWSWLVQLHSDNTRRCNSRQRHITECTPGCVEDNRSTCT